jgi:hypothetical protein
MTSLTIHGWEPGFRKVSHTVLLQSQLGLSLSEAKAATDRVLLGESVSFELESEEVATLLAQKLVELGARVELANASRRSI